MIHAKGYPSEFRLSYIGLVFSLRSLDELPKWFIVMAERKEQLK